jgi:tRNA threonylcarbamoyladenosine biosynthesis protein TsaB
MRILALETTDKIGSVAASDGDKPLAELILDATQRSAQSLLPAVDALLKQVGWTPAEVQLVAVSIGPGSFTGLRVGVTAAKVFAYAVGAEVLGINTSEVLAANCQETRHNRVSVVTDAQRGEIVVQSFQRQSDNSFTPVAPEQLLEADVWLAQLVAGTEVTAGTEVVVAKKLSLLETVNRQPPPSPSLPPPPNLRISNSPNHTIITGPGLARLLDRLPTSVEALNQDLWRPRAAVVARLAARHYAEGRRDDLWKLVPHYYRRSAAEEKLDRELSPSLSQRQWDSPPHVP